VPSLGVKMNNVTLKIELLFFFCSSRHQLKETTSDDVPVELDMDHWSFALSDAQKQQMIAEWRSKHKKAKL
jgi:hypothetical protein